MNIGDTVKVIGVPPNLRDDEDMRTRMLFQKCVGESFVVAGIERPEGLPHRLVQLDVGHVLGEEPYVHTIWIEEELVELNSTIG